MTSLVKEQLAKSPTRAWIKPLPLQHYLKGKVHHHSRVSAAAGCRPNAAAGLQHNTY